MDRYKNIVSIMTIFLGMCLGIDILNTKNIKTELYQIADLINKDITKYGAFRNELKEELADTYYVDINIIHQDETLLTYNLIKKYQNITIINNNEVTIEIMVWINYL